MSHSETLLLEFDQEMINTRKILELVPDDKLEYKPHEKSMPLGRLASHVAELPSWAAHALTSESLNITADFQPVVAANRAELLALFDKSVAEARSAIAAARDEDYAVVWTFLYNGAPVFAAPRAGVIRGSVLNHLIHHRAQLGVYLRMLDIAIPGMYGPSADEMQFWNPSAASA